MSSHNRMTFDGLAELKEALKNLPAELTREASAIVLANAEKAKQEIIAEYPIRTGNLKNHVTVTRVNGTFTAGAVVKNTAKHAWLYDNGSQARHTDIGANRGSMPTTHTFVKAIIRRRHVMYEVLKDMLTKAGLLASGDA